MYGPLQLVSAVPDHSGTPTYAQASRASTEMAYAIEQNYGL